MKMNPPDLPWGRWAEEADTAAESFKQLSSSVEVFRLELVDVIDSERPDLRSTEIAECALKRIQKL
jgi:hypothetical protein